VAARLREVIESVALEIEARIHALEVMPDHVHLFLESDPRWPVASLVSRFKGRSSRVLRQEFPSLRSRLPTLWSRSYFAASVGSVTEVAIQRYLEAQKGVEMRRTYRYRLYPTRAQTAALEAQLAFCCDLYHAALQERREAGKKGVRVGFHDQARQLTEIRRGGMAPPMNSWTQIDALKRLDRAFEAFFRRCQAGEKPGYPRFRSKRRYDSLSWSFSGNAGGVELVGGRLRLQGVGHVKVKWHRQLPKDASLKVATVVRHGNRWAVGFSLTGSRAAPPERQPAEVGIDLGVATFAALSNGELIPGPRAGRRAAGRVKRLQRIVARRKRGSNRRRQAVALLARARAHEREVRRDHRHQLARDLVRRFTFIAVEDLPITNMTRSARGTVEAPGSNVRQKAGLNRSQLDQAWRAFLMTLRNKAEAAGSVVVEVDPRNTSRTGHECGAVDPASRRSQAEFVCTACGHRDHADVNAAKNILRLGRSRQEQPCAAA
jgi:putative transposase